MKSVLVGIDYSLFQVRSPAPPLVAQIGLLGMPDSDRKAASFENVVSQILRGRPSITSSAYFRGGRSARLVTVADANERKPS